MRRSRDASNVLRRVVLEIRERYSDGKVRWDLAHNINAVVTDNGANFVAAASALTRKRVSGLSVDESLRFVCHTLQLVINDVLSFKPPLPLMQHHYEYSPYSIRTQQGRLKPASALHKAGIKCLVWGEDALAFIYLVPTRLFDLHLVVPDQDVNRASNEIMQSLPYNICSSLWKAGLICSKNAGCRAFAV